MTLQQNDIHVWIIPLHLEESAIEASFALLNREEQFRANRFHFTQHRTQFVAAHVALRKILSLYLTIDPLQIEFQINEYGKPFLTSSELQFNLAHSHDLALLAVATNEIGIDLEYRQASYEPGVAKRFFSETEYEQLQGFSEQEQIPAFYEFWARKEAVLKAVGKGLHLPLKSFSVDITNGYEELVLESRVYKIIPVAVDSQFAAAVASTTAIKSILFRRYLPQKW